MAASTDVHVFRTSTSPARGGPISTSTRRKSDGRTSPRGYVIGQISRDAVMPELSIACRLRGNERLPKYCDTRREELRHERQRLSRYRGDRDERGILGGGGEERRGDRGDNGSRPADRRGDPLRCDDRRRKGFRVPGPPRHLVQVRGRNVR